MPFYELMKLAVLAKQTFILPQNQQVRLYGNFVILTRFLESLLQQVSGSCLIFVKKNIKNIQITNFALRIVLAAGMTYFLNSEVELEHFFDFLLLSKIITLTKSFLSSF